MAQKLSNCPHVSTVGDNTWEDVYRKKQVQDECDLCETPGPNLWLCLYDRCLAVGCGESAADHSSSHAESKCHSLTLNLTTFRIWCYTCECEVYKDANVPPLRLGERFSQSPPNASQQLPDRYGPPPLTPPRCPTPTHDESDSEDEDDMTKPRGLTGLQNIGNTCYMNSAIQAISNCPPMTRFFLDCQGYVKTDKKPMLSKCYMKLMSELWHKKRPSYLVPSSVAHGIKLVYPMFRGYTQQDAQEFLRCFMDQIHEELKQVVHQDPDVANSDMSPGAQDEYSPSDSSCDEEPGDTNMNQQQTRSSPLHKSKQSYKKITREIESSDMKVDQSDGEYETCDSGLSSNRNSAEPSVSSGDEASLVSNGVTLHESNSGSDCSRTSSQTSVNQKPNVKIPDAEIIGSMKRNEEDDTVSQCGTLDSGIGSPSSSTLVSSSNSAISCASDEQTTPTRSTKTKSTKDMANKQQQQYRQEAEIVQTNGSASTADVDLEYCDITADIDQRVMGQVKRSKSQTEKKSRSRSSSDITLGQGSTSRGKSGKKKLPVYQSVVSDIYDGKLLSSVQCLTCERISSTRETFQDLSLPIPSKDYLHTLHARSVSQGGPTAQKGTCGEVHLNQGWMSWIFGWVKSWFWGPTITLRDCLATFFSADELKGDNMYSCGKCKKLRNGMKYSKVLKLPEILCIHLKRFRHEFMFSSKINSYVSFPLENLDMGPYLHKNCQDQVTKYDLVSVICHHGTAGGGHYTAYAQNYANDQWYEFDDQYVTEVDQQQVENCEAYVLFYRKQNEQMIPLRQKAEQILENMESTFLRFFISKQWINKFNTFAEPGPINNSDFLCHHGGVHPHKWNYVGELVQEVPQKLWEYLHDMFGGGPAVNRLYLCDDCQLELDRLKARQKTEMDTFLRLHDIFQSEDYGGKIYAINMAWFKEWENFVRAKTTDPPGPIENSKICIVRQGQSILRMNSDYGQLSEELWSFLFEIYGGGPELLIKQNRPPSPTVTVHKVDEEGHGKTTDVKA